MRSLELIKCVESMALARGSDEIWHKYKLKLALSDQLNLFKSQFFAPSLKGSWPDIEYEHLRGYRGWGQRAAYSCRGRFLTQYVWRRSPKADHNVGIRRAPSGLVLLSEKTSSLNDLQRPVVRPIKFEFRTATCHEQALLEGLAILLPVWPHLARRLCQITDINKSANGLWFLATT